ncbi:MAG: hypothetical protein QXT74_00090 [Candidatus Nezhaarchaeales archaeon]
MEIVKCSRCGYVLHEGVELVTPKDVVRKYNGKCPNCSSQLNVKGVKIQVKGA